MTKIQVEIDDTLDERIQNVKDEIKQNFIEYLKENKDIDDFDTYYQKQGCDSIHGIVDSNTPIYTKEIDDLYYLYGSEFEEAYGNAGIGTGGEDNHQQVAIFCYLEEKGFDYLRELEDKFRDIVVGAFDTGKAIDELIKELE